ncbi:MAG: N-acetylneuraminate synthase family protein [Deltaproteobacteria bacterium]|nr:N-acetylneuraminate synthase family protein [Deltaproteobacteria bacterium]MBN2674617.1 N-acetylneuraminate synthase family protein [Deltaproteobacteria bacterium]
MTPLFISEVSSNHQQNLERCLKFVDISAQIGCDAVKFQLFRIEKLFSPEILSKSEFHSRRKAWELPLAFIPKIKERCVEKKLQFGCTPFYLDAVDQLNPYVDFYKIASYELLWNDLLTKCAQTKKPIVLSTGMATIEEIHQAVSTIRNNGCTNLTVLHCVSAYPAPPEECNLNVISAFRSDLKTKVGWSDHSVAPSVIYRAALDMKSDVIEFHLDLEGDGEEYESGHCWLPHEIALVIRTIREAELAGGSACKKTTASEQPDRDWRADPEDGLRPLKHIRKVWHP